LPADPRRQQGRGALPRLSRGRQAGPRFAAAGDAEGHDHVPGGGGAEPAGVRRGGDDDQSRPGRDHGALQIGLSVLTVSAGVEKKGTGRLTTALLLAPAAFWFLMLLILPLAVVIVYSF